MARFRGTARRRGDGAERVVEADVGGEKPVRHNRFRGVGRLLELGSCGGPVAVRRVQQTVANLSFKAFMAAKRRRCCAA